MPERNSGLYLTKQLRLCEGLAKTKLNLSENTLMTRAGLGAFTILKSLFPKAQKIAIFCGGGNNAGDGYIVAKLAHQSGISVRLYQYKDLDTLPAAALAAANDAIAAGVICLAPCDKIDNDVDLVIDALLGIGLEGNLREPFSTAAKLINDNDIPVLAIDIPTGLNADTGNASPNCIRATATVTFIAPTTGMYTADGPDNCGKIFVNQLQLDNLLSTIPPTANLLADLGLQPMLKPRKKNSHKGDFGNVLIIGGGIGMPGAVNLAASAAFRVGAGSVSIATLPMYANSSIPGLPEAMIFPISKACDIKTLLDRATVCVIGPGLGEDDWAKELFNMVAESRRPLVVDASALHLLAKAPVKNNNRVLTPHPGEAAALLSSKVIDIQSDRIQAITNLQQKYGGIILLKGVGSLIIDNKRSLFLCPKGNPGMASAGMGDVLSGIIAGLAAQGVAIDAATKYGALLHASAGDLAAKKIGQLSMSASDVINNLAVFLK